MTNQSRIPLYADIRTLTAAQLWLDLGRLPEVIVGSPPCQDASVANQQGLGVDGERTGLFFEAIRLVRDCHPVWCCFENVPGIRTRGADRIISELETEGYSVWPLVVGARDVGSECERKRVWFLAADTNSASRAFGKGISEDAGTQQPTAQRSAACSWDVFTTAVSSRVRAFDGIPDWLAVACADAYGDAVVPQITMAIGRTMMRLIPTDGTVLDLFCGAAGGWSLGLHRAGYRTIAACEIDPWRRAAFLQHNFDV